MRQFKRAVRPIALVTVLVALSSTSTDAARLSPGSLAGWTAYVSATERRMAREVATRDRFLGLDFQADVTDVRRRLQQGEVVVVPVETTDPTGRALDVPDALVQHWRGAVFIPGISAATLVDRLQRGAPPTRQEDVVRSAVLERGPDHMRVFLRLQKKKIVTVTYNTEHDVRFARYGTGRASSTTIATKIAELKDAGTPAESELPQGDDRGFLWKLNAYWRYQDVPGGVIAECESVSLSRDVPSIVWYLVMPIVERTARESMERTLVSLRDRAREARDVGAPAL